MRELEKILEEIDNLKSECLNGEYEPAYGAGALDMANAIKDIIRSLSRENDSEITRSSRDTEGWIPVEERLPEEAGTYIINALTGERNIVTFAKWQNRYKRFDMTGARTYWKIIAWCPLPEPYRPERSDNHDE